MEQKRLNREKIIDGKELGIYIITYNRANSLKKTLEDIAESELRGFPITILNNCSTDNTLEVVESFFDILPNINVTSNKYNIGLGANFLKAFDLSEFRYTWVLCDDDRIEVQNFDDVLEVIKEGEIDLIHVGAHPQNNWPLGGQRFTPKGLLENAYPYFRFSSFIPCNIFRTKAFTNKGMADAYANVVNAYPHMPFLFSLYKSNKEVYISDKQLVFAKLTSDGYSLKTWSIWWMKTCELLDIKDDVKLAYMDQWKDIGVYSNELALRYFAHSKSFLDDKDYVKKFQEKYFNAEEINLINIYEGIKVRPSLLRRIYNKFVKQKK